MTKRKETLIAEVKIEGQYRVQWTIDRFGRHTIRYGADVRAFPKKQDMEASQQFGYFVRHAAECDGRLDT